MSTLPDGRLLGAADLGLTIEWRFRFVPPGTRAETTPGAVYLDVGGRLDTGVIDHHAEVDGATSTAELVAEHREKVYVHLLGPVLQDHYAGRSITGRSLRFTLVTHSFPDFDSVVSTLLSMHLVTYGDLPAHARALVGYATLVDQGRLPLELDDPLAYLAPHHGYLAIQSAPPAGPGSPSDRMMAAGLALLERAVDDLTEAAVPLRAPHSFLAGSRNPAAARWTEDERFADAVELLRHEPDRFASDREHAVTPTVCLPATDPRSSEPVEVPCFVLRRPPESKLNKYWVRAAGYPLFVCPYQTTAAGRQNDDPDNGIHPRVIVSLDPNWREPGTDRQPSLRSLGFALEKAESKVRRATRAGTDDRGGPPRWDDGTCDNADPWYDGRGHGWSIIDAPHSGTQLPYDDIVGVVTGGTFWHVPLDAAVVIMMWAGPLDARTSGHERPYRDEEIAHKALRELYRESRRVTLELDVHTELRSGIEATSERVLFPTGTAPSLDVLRLRAGGGVTLEALVELRNLLRARFEAPDYAMARVHLGRHNSDPQAIEELLRGLGDSDVVALPGLDSKTELVLFNSRNLLVQRTAGTTDHSTADPDYELLSYAAFLNHTLAHFETRIGEVVLATERLDRQAARVMRQDFLRFQTRYFDLEVSRTGRGRRISTEMADSMNLYRHYREVQDQLARLAEIEEEEDERARARSAAILEFALFFLASAGVFQTVIAFLTWDGFDRRAWWWMSGVFVVLSGIYGTAVWLRRRRD